MSLRFRRTMKVAPGVRLNFGLRGMSVSMGPRGAGVTFGNTGVTSHVGIPGTGLSLRDHAGSTNKSHRVAQSRGPSETTVGITVRIEDDGALHFLDGSGNALPPKLEKLARVQLADEIHDHLKRTCAKRNQQIEALLGIHRGTPPPGHYRGYIRVAFSQPEPTPPFERTPGFFTRLFRKRREVFLGEVAEERSRWEDAHRAWEKARTDHEEREDLAAKRFSLAQEGDADAMEAVLDPLLKSIEWPRETSVSFHFFEGTKGLFLDVDLPEVEDMPTETVSIAGQDRSLSIKSRSDAQRRRDYVSHVHGVTFRLIGEAFALLSSVQCVVCSGYSQRSDSATGHVRDDYLLSVRVDLEAWAQIAFDRLDQLDPVDALGGFEIVRRILPNGRLATITPISPPATRIESTESC